jgi:hypothetical protein
LLPQPGATSKNRTREKASSKLQHQKLHGERQKITKPNKKIQKKTATRCAGEPLGAVLSKLFPSDENEKVTKIKKATREEGLTKDKVA